MSREVLLICESFSNFVVLNGLLQARTADI